MTLLSPFSLPLFALLVPTILLSFIQMHMKWPIAYLKAKSFRSNSSNNPCGGSQVSIEIRDTLVENTIQTPTSKDEKDKDGIMPSFSVSLERLAEVVEINDLDSLDHSDHKIQQIAAALVTNIHTGIVGDERDLDCRIRAFGLNEDLKEFPSPLNKSLYHMVLEAFKDTTIILLLCCATLSLLIDIKRNGSEKGFIDGTIIFVAIFIVVNFSNIFRFFKARIMLKRLQKHEKFACVVRQGQKLQIPASEVVVGDVVLLKAGDQVPADGLFIDGSSCKLDDGLIERGAKHASMFTGAKLVEGNCRMMVTSVGKNTERSKLIRSSVRINEGRQMESKLQNGIDKMNSRLEKFWLSLSLLILMVQVLRCFVWKSFSDESRNPDPKGVKNTVEEIVNEATKILKRQGGKINGLVGMLCILLFATRDGLPLGIFVVFFFASKKMKSLIKTMVQKLPACAEQGLVTTVCLSKTDDLILRHSEMAELWIGLKCIKDVSKEVNGHVLEKLQVGVCMKFSECQTAEDSLLCWAQQVLNVNLDELERNCNILQNGLVDVDRNRSILVLRTSEETKLELHWRGAPEFILCQCSHYYDVDGTMQTLDEEKRGLFNQIVGDIASDDFQCFAFAYKKVTSEESTSQKLEEGDYDGAVHDDDDNANKETLKFKDHGLTFIGMLRFKNPYAPEIKQAVQACRDLGVNIKLMVDDNVKNARIMALHSGIFRPEQDREVAVVEGSVFRNSSDEARMRMMDNFHVIANSSPADKLLMVQCLRKKAEVVAITSSCIRDFPSLIEADVGIYMGNNSGKMAKEDADIITAGLNIGTLAALLRLGRYVCQSIEMFLELHLTLNISAFTINLIFEFSTSEVQLSSVQLLWTNLIVEALGALALVMMVGMETSNPQNQGDSRWCIPPPVYGSGPIITMTMLKNIVVQSLFQVAILTILGMKGKYIFHVDDNVLRTMIFNSYVLCQVFILMGAMKLKKTNILQELFSREKCLFLAVVGVILVLQMLLIEIMGVVAHWGKLDFKRWGICIGTAAVSSSLVYAAKRVSDFALARK